MAGPDPVVKFTYEDYLRTPDDKLYELIDGELILTPIARQSSPRSQG